MVSDNVVAPSATYDDLDPFGDPQEQPLNEDLLAHLRAHPPIQEIQDWAWIVGHRVSGAKRRILDTLARYSDHTGESYPELKTIGYHCDLAYQTVCGEIKELALIGLVEVSKQANNEGCHNRYRLTGYLTDWIPDPPPAKKARSFVDEVAIVMKGKDARIESLERLLARVSLGMSTEELDAEIQAARKEGSRSSFISPDPVSEEITTTTTNELESSFTQDETLSPSFVREVEEAVERHWKDHLSKTWKKGRASAIHWYLRNPAEFAIQMKAIEAEIADRDRIEPEPGDQGDQSRRVVTTEPDPEALKVMVEVLEIMKAQVPKPSYDTWLADCSGHSLSETQFVIVAKSATGAEWVERRMYQSLHRTVETVLGRNIDEVVLAVRAQSEEVS